MKGIITCMTCMFAVALTVGVPIRRQASQLEKTVPIRGNVTLLCPFVPDDLWEYVYWKKNNHTIYSLEVKSNTPATNNTRYEGSNHATRLTIKDLQKTDSGIYHCKVATLVFIKERGHVLLSVADQEVGLSTTSPGVPFRASTMIPPEPAEDNTIYLVYATFSFIISITISVISVCLVFKYRQRIKDFLAGFLSALRRLAWTKSTSTPVAPDYANREIRDKAPRSTTAPLAPDRSDHEVKDEEGTRTNLLSSDTHGRDDVDLDDRPEKGSNASQSLEGTRTNLLSSDTHGRDDVDVDDSQTKVQMHPSHLGASRHLMTINTKAQGDCQDEEETACILHGLGQQAF